MGLHKDTLADSMGSLAAMALSQNAMSLSGLAERQANLVRRLGKYALPDVVAAVGGLLTRPENHPNTVRLEALCHLAGMVCRGKLPIPAANLREWLNGVLLADDLGRAEDPVEDVFVSTVVSWTGTTRIFEGIWEANDFYLQSCLAALNAPECRRLLGLTFAPIRALLSLSEAVANRSKAQRFGVSQGSARARIRLTSEGVRDGSRRVTFSRRDLDDLSISEADLAPFVFQSDDVDRLRDETVGHTSLERRPLVRAGTDIWVLALPTAVSAAVRRFILATAITNGLTDRFRKALSEDQLNRLLLAARIGWNVEPLSSPIHRDDLGVHEFIGTFDVGAYAQVLLMHDDLDTAHIEGLQDMQMVLGGLDDCIRASSAELSRRPDYRRGMTIVVHGGIGRGFAAAFEQTPPGWRILGLSLHDFELLGRETGLSALRAWKLLQLVDELEAGGLTLVNPGGFVNLYAYLVSRDFEPVPAEMASGMVYLGDNFVFGLRRRLRRAYDFHAVRHREGGAWVEVERRTPDSLFGDELERPLYVSPAEASRGNLVGCVETPLRVWWVECHDPDRDPSSASVIFQIWDMALSWLGKATEVLDEAVSDLPAGCAFILSFPDLGTWTEGRVFDTGPATPPVVQVIGREVKIACTRAYLGSFRNAENLGDRWMVEAMVEGALRLGRACADRATIGALVARIVPDTVARFFHTLPALTAGDVVRASVTIPEPHLIQAEDKFRSRLNLPRLAGFEGPVGPLTKAEAMSVLGGAVQAVWVRIRDNLLLLERADLIERAMLNHEAIENDRRVWGMTAAAVIALHPNRTATLKVANLRESDRSQASTSLRVLVEMALCTAPLEGGLPCTTADLDVLVADVAVLIETANLKDALFYGLTDGLLTVRANMTFGVDAVLTSALRGGYLEAQGNRAFVDAAGRYGNHFGSPAAENASAIEPGFEAAFCAEFGATLRSLADVAFMFADRTGEAGLPLIRLRESEVVGAVADRLHVHTRDAARVIDSLSLKPRVRWDEDHPCNATKRDWYPWRYGRKLSLIRRPLVKLSDSPDPEMIVCPGLLDRSLRHLSGVYTARLPGEMFDTEEVRRWIGTAIDRIGHAFNIEVRNRLRALGLQAEAETKMTVLGGSRELGDVDVIAWRRGGQKVYVIECKRLSPARTLGEIGERLGEYTDRSAGGRGRTPVRKHLDRIAWLEANMPAIARFTGLVCEPLVLRSCLITDELVPMQFSAESAALVDVIVNLEALPAVTCSW